MLRILTRWMVGVALLVGGACGWILWGAALQPHPDRGWVVWFPPNNSFQDFVGRLHTQHQLPHPRGFRWLASLVVDSNRLPAGEYALPVHARPWDVLMALRRGEVRTYPVRLGEGWTLQAVLSGLRDHDALCHDVSRADPPSAEAMWHAVGVERSCMGAGLPEGLLFPDTYWVVRGTLESQVLKRAAVAMQRHVERLWLARDPSLPYTTRCQPVIVASIVEKETAKSDERPRIAGVLLRRWQQGMLLQMDPTVAYGLGPDHRGALSRKDLMEDTPFNTYLHKGLPPTPIALPSLVALQAAFAPTQERALYFVARGDGTHVFSETLAEHEHAVAAYRRRSQHS